MGKECEVKLGQKWTKIRAKIVSDDNYLPSNKIRAILLSDTPQLTIIQREPDTIDTVVYIFADIF